MRKRWICISLLIMSMILVSGFACTSTPSLVGKWQNDEEGLHLEFFKDGRIIVDDGLVSTGKYELVGEDYVKFNLDGGGGLLGLLLSSNTLKVNVSGDIMTLRIMDDNVTFRRVR